jgi:hypothetical protein
MRNGDYLLVVAPDEYPGKRYRGRYCYEHHLVYWQHTGDTVKNGEVIHHRNGNKHDNRFENLEKLENSVHTSLHSRPKTMIRLVCALCGIEFEREARNVNFYVRRGRDQFYCRRECYYESVRNKT